MHSFRSLTRLAVLMAVLWLCGAAYGSVLAEFDETVDFEDATGAQTSMPPQKVDYTKATHGSSVTVLGGAPVIHGGSVQYGTYAGYGRWPIEMSLPESRGVSFTLLNGLGEATYRVQASYFNRVAGVHLSEVQTVTLGAGGATRIELNATNIDYVRVAQDDSDDASPDGLYGFYIDDVTFKGRTLPPPAVVFVPGAAASTLKSPNGVEWFDLATLFASWDALSLDPAVPHPPIRATDVTRSLIWGFSDVYGVFLARLRATGLQEYEIADPPVRLTSAGCDATQINADLFVFPYDWRRSNAEAAVKFADYVRCINKIHVGRKISIVAHSMGGLVARRAILENPDLRYSITQVITVGSPWLGAPKAVAALTSGTFFGFRAHDIKALAEYFPGMHELLPTETYFANPPTLSDGVRTEIIWPLRYVGNAGNGAHRDYATYNDFVAELDQRFPRSRPGSAGRSFHGFPGQDSSAGDSPNTVPRWIHIVSKLDGRKTTICRVNEKQEPWWVDTGNGTYAVQWRAGYKWTMCDGDGTVPLSSAERTPQLLSALSSTIHVTGDASTSNHVKMMHKASVMDRIVDILAHPNDPVPLGPLARSAPPTWMRLGAEAEAEEPAVRESVYVTLIGPSSIAVRDAAGQVQSSAPQTLQEMEDLPGATIDVAGESSYSVVLDPARGPYRVTYQAGAEPVGIEVLLGTTNLWPRSATRFQDVAPPAGTMVQLTVSSDGSVELAQDADGNGTFETGVPESFKVTGTAAEDLEAPTVSFSGWPALTISAADAGSGVKRILYSLDGATTFRVYTGPINVGVEVDSVIAVAEDNAGNRTGPFTRPADGGPTTILVEDADIGYGSSWQLMARLTGGGAPLAGRTLTFAVAGVELSAVTDSQGYAIVNYTPATVGVLDATVRFAQYNRWLASTAAFQVTVFKAEPVLRYTGPVSVASGSTVEMRARLTRRGVPVAGANVTFEMSGQSRGGVTNADGTAAVLMPVIAPPGRVLVRVHFDGDELHEPVSINVQPLVTAPPSLLSALSVDQHELAAGATATGTVTLTAAASATRLVTLRLEPSGAPVVMPSSVTVPSGAATAIFTLQAGATSSFQQATLIAELDGRSASTSVRIRPAGAAMPPSIPPADRAWIDDGLPQGATIQNGYNGALLWTEAEAAGGVRSLADTGAADVRYTTYINGLHERVEIGQDLLLYARVDAGTPLREILVRWHTDNNYACAYWGEATVGPEALCRSMGPVPAAGWNRLEVPADLLLLENQTVDQIEITHIGRAGFDLIGVTGMGCIAAAAAPPVIPAGDTTFVDDSLPGTAWLQNIRNGAMHWDSSQSASGTRSLVSNYRGTGTLLTTSITDLNARMEIGENAVAYFHVSECAPPQDIRLIWYTSLAEVCAYWGPDAGAGTCRKMGAVPAPGWTRVEIPASVLRIEQSTVYRIELSHLGGQVWFDHIGKSGPSCIAAVAPPPSIPDGDTLFVEDALSGAAWLQNIRNGAMHWDATQAASGTRSLVSDYRGVDTLLTTSISDLNQRMEIGENAVAYLHVSECAAPQNVRITWFTTLGQACAYWGPSSGAGPCRQMAAVPAPGWTRVEIPASALRIEQSMVNRIELSHLGGQVWFDHIGKSGTACLAAAAAAPSIPAGDTLFVDDSLPAGAWLQNIRNGAMHWDSTQAASGTRSLVSDYRGADTLLTTSISDLNARIETGQQAVAYFSVSECSAPRDIRIIWYTTAGERCAFWGANGNAGTCRPMGAVPLPGWTRVEIPAATLGIESSTVNRIELSHTGGQVWFDHIGKSGN
jgi:pimeloyl-ACP methyl ester carboxylesterase